MNTYFHGVHIFVGLRILLCLGMSRTVSHFSAVLHRVVQVLLSPSEISKQTSSSLVDRLNTLLDEEQTELVGSAATEDALSKCWKLYSSKKRTA